MGLEVTDAAIEVLARSLQMGGVDLATGGARLRAAKGLGGGMDVQVELAEGPLAGEAVMEKGGVRLFVDPEVAGAFPDAVVTVEPQHDHVVLRPKEAGRETNE